MEDRSPPRAAFENVRSLPPRRLVLGDQPSSFFPDCCKIDASDQKLLAIEREIEVAFPQP
jgi:hypothetical protein